jgi:hypothetical protein
MEDRELYRRILGVENPWRVASVDLQLAPREVHIHPDHEDLPAWPCAECGAPCKLYDHQAQARAVFNSLLRKAAKALRSSVSMSAGLRTAMNLYSYISVTESLHSTR